MHELPPRHDVICIADVGCEAAEAKLWLDAHGRAARIRRGFVFGSCDQMRLWSPNPFLERVLTGIRGGHAIDLACGSGRDAVFIASCGFNVTAVDHLADALGMGRELERRYLGEYQPIDWVCEDLDRYLPPGSFDLVACFYYLNRRLLSKAIKSLGPDGHLVVETFTTIHRSKFGKPKSELLVLQPGELQDLCAELSIIEHEEAWHGDRHTARLHGVRHETAIS